MAMGGGSKGGRAVPYINVTPLIDVLLVLLIIFMVVTPMKPSRFKALIPEPPKPEEANVKPYELNLRVDIMKDGKLQLNTEPYGGIDDTSKLSAKLAEIFRGRTESHTVKPGTDQIEKTVFIKAPKSVKYGDVAKVLDAVKGAGADPVGLQVDALEQ